MCPIETYINGIRKPSDTISLLLRTGVSVSFRSSSPDAAAEDALSSLPSVLFFAPYPAASTAAMTSAEETSPSTPMEFVKRLTEQDVTPSTPETAFSIRALHAAQLIPFTIYCSIILLLTSKFCKYYVLPKSFVLVTASASAVCRPIHLKFLPSPPGYPPQHKSGYDWQEALY